MTDQGSGHNDVMTRAVAYLRVSTNEQASNGLGLPVQRERILAVAAEQGLTIVDWCIDAGKSGSDSIDVRDELADAIAALREGRAEVMLVARLDRLARDLVLTEVLLSEITKAGGTLRSCWPGEDQHIIQADDEDPTRVLIRQLLGALGQWERSMIRLRLRAGKRHKMRNGGYGGGGVGFGASLVDDRLAVDPERVPLLERIAAMRAEGADYREIAAQLNADGVPGPGGGVWHDTGARRTYLRYCQITGRSPQGRSRR